MEFDKWLGRRQAFSLAAGRSSAADAECLRELRSSKRYRSLKLTWEQCCKLHLGISRPAADKIVHQIEEFRSDYFVPAQVKRASAAASRPGDWAEAVSTTVAPSIGPANSGLMPWILQGASHSADRMAAVCGVPGMPLRPD